MSLHELQIARWLDHARASLARGHVHGAIDALRRALTLEPEHAGAHAWLALCLLEQRRIFAADLEAKKAVALEPESAFCHHALARALIAHRKLRDAAREAEQALALEPEEPGHHRTLALIEQLRGRRDEARRRLQQALELDPEDPETLCALGRWELEGGSLAEARRLAREALEIEPEHHDALVLMGTVLLCSGDVEGAADHAVWALRQNASDRGALYLMAGIQARRSLWLGLWWRYNAWLGRLGDGRAILVLVMAFVVYSVARTWSEAHAMAMTVSIVQLAWIALCVYTWIGPALFERSVRRQLERVRLREGF